MKFINWVFLAVTLLILAFVSTGIYKHFFVNSFQNNNQRDQGSYDFTRFLVIDSNENVAAGSVAEFQISFSDTSYDQNELVADLFFSQDKINDQKAKTNVVNGNKVYRVKTDLNEEQVNYYFVLNYQNKNVRYPSNGYLTKRLVQASDLEMSDINHEPLTYADIKSKSKADIAIQVADTSSVGDIVLYFSTNDLPFQSDIIEYSNNYKTQIYLPSDLEKLKYYFEVETINSKLQYPEISEFILFDTNKQNAEDELINYVKDHHFDLNLKFDNLRGDVIDINSDQRVSGLSTIKLYIMLEVYRQLSEGKLSMTDQVSRYGYSGTVEQALRSMMISSVNEAAGALILKVGGTESINETIKEYLGSDSKSVINHTPGYLEHGYNYVTAEDQVKLLSLLHNKTILPDQADAMISLMGECSDYFNVRSISGIDDIAMKTGYAPSSSFGLIGIVNGNSEKPYTFAMHIQAHKDYTVRTSDIRNLLIVLQNYSSGL